MRAGTTTLELVADIGGTNARFACVASGEDTLLQLHQLPCAAYPHILDAIRSYMQLLPSDIRISRICLAVAGPVERDEIDLPNNHWAFSRSQLAAELGCEVHIINDFTAQMLGAAVLNEDQLQWLGPARPDLTLVLAALGPGTGLGVAGLTPGGEIIPSEGGHLAFAPTTVHEVDLLEQLWLHYPRVSVERLLSGPGLGALYLANARIAGKSVDKLAPEAISAGARAGDTLCRQSLQDFIGILGSVAGEVAIALGARGGVYLCGGILPRIEGLYEPALLRERFNDKGRFTDYCSTIALAQVKAPHNGLHGCVQALRKDNTPGNFNRNNS
jgi:glucokinase